MLDLYDFQREIDHNGILSHNKYFVRIDPTDSVPIASDVPLLRALAIRAVGASFPGMQLMTQDNLRYGFGPTEKSPHNAIYTDAHLSFLVDSRSKVYDFWYKWLRYIVPADSSSSMFSVQGDPTIAGPATGGSGPYEVEYKDNYIADITISPTSELHNNSMDCILYRAWPYHIQELQLDASAQNSPVILNILIAYRDHKIINRSLGQGIVFTQ